MSTANADSPSSSSQYRPDSDVANINPEAKYVDDEEKKKTEEEKTRNEEKKIVENIDIDELIAAILNVGTPGCSLQETVRIETIMSFCSIVKDSFMLQRFMIEIDGPVKICGDTHGQYSDVLRLLDRGGFPPCSNYLFLGDYVDRGHQNLEVVLLFMAYKVKYPYNFFLLRGNHECRSINRVYGFFEECARRYNVRIWTKFQDVFAQMPYVALVGGRILCMHGGLSEHLTSLTQLREEKRRPLDLPNPSILMDLLWADPEPNVRGWLPNSRGVSVVFGPEQVKEKLQQLGVDLIVRAHQVVQDGYEFFADRRLVTIFSAPHYCGQFNNNAAMMDVSADNVCSFHILQPQEKDKPVKLVKVKWQ